jgi:uncharacterized protein
MVRGKTSGAPQRRRKVTSSQVRAARERIRPIRPPAHDPLPPRDDLRDLFSPALHPKAATPPKTAMAMDDALVASTSWAASAVGASFQEGLQFLGYPYLAMLAQRVEYRTPSEIIAEEMTREWITFEATGDEDKTDKINQLEEEFDRLEVKENFFKFTRDDGLFGRGHLYVDLGTTNDGDELKTPIGDGKNALSRLKVQKGSLVRLKTVEPVWAYPTNYDSIDPLSPRWYNPDHWYVMGKDIHASRLLKMVSHEVPDLLKPAYSFGGLSRSQMLKPYVDNWLKTRQSVNDLISAFTTWVFGTDLSETLTAEGDLLFERLELFTACKNNRDLFLYDKDTEEFNQVNASLGTLDTLQAQAQEHMASAARIPLVKWFGISPQGLNATAEPEIRVFYDTIRAAQNAPFFNRNLRRIMHFAMLNLWGEIDPEIGYRYNPLWTLDEKGKADVREIDARTGASLIEAGVISQEEERQRVAEDPNTLYPGLDASEMPDLKGEEEEGLAVPGAGGAEKAILNEGEEKPPGAAPDDDDERPGGAQTDRPGGPPPEPRMR